jgi:hypothetical protein
MSRPELTSAHSRDGVRPCSAREPATDLFSDVPAGRPRADLGLLAGSVTGDRSDAVMDRKLGSKDVGHLRPSLQASPAAPWSSLIGGRAVQGLGGGGLMNVSPSSRQTSGRCRGYSALPPCASTCCPCLRASTVSVSHTTAGDEIVMTIEQAVGQGVVKIRTEVVPGLVDFEWRSPA